MTNNPAETLQSKWQELSSLVRSLVQMMVSKGINPKVDTEGALATMQQSIEASNAWAKGTQQQLDQLQSLIQQSALITSSLELDRVLEGVIDTVVRLTGAERAYLMLRDKPGDDLTIRTARNWSPDSSNFSSSVVQAAIEHKEVIITTNAMQDERFHVAESIVASALRSILCIPLILGEQVVGVLYADSRLRAGIFQPTLVPLLTAFATQAAIAIQNAKAFAAVKDDLAQARHEIEELRIQIDKEAVQRQVNEITESDYFQHLLGRVHEVRSEFGL